MRNRSRLLSEPGTEQLEPRLFLSGESSPDIFFSPARPIKSVIVVDFDGDGVKDIAVWSGAVRPPSDHPQPKSVLSILANDGEGRFSQVLRRRFAVPAGRLAAGDFDGQPGEELALATNRPAQTSLLRLLKFESGEGRWTVPVVLQLDARAKQLEPLTGADGRTRLLVALGEFDAGIETGRLEVYEQNGIDLELAHAVQLENGRSFHGVRIVEADGDDSLDVLALDKLGADRRVLLFQQDPAEPGLLNAATEIATGVDPALSVPLYGDMNDDGVRDLVLVDVRQRVLLLPGNGMGFDPADVLIDQEFVYPYRATPSLYGSGVGPDGEFEIWVIRHTVNLLGPESSSSLVRLVRSDDGAFESRIAFLPIGGQPNAQGIYIVAELTPDAVPDFVLLSTRFHDPVPDRRLRVYTFDGTNQKPFVAEVLIDGGLTQRTVTTGSFVSLNALASDPEAVIYHNTLVESITLVRFYLDVNGNGTIDADDLRMAARPHTSVVTRVRSHWPRGTFHVLAQARDTEGNWSGAACSALPLTIV